MVILSLSLSCSLSLFISLSLSFSLSHPYSLFPFSSKILQTNFCFASNAQLTFCHSSRFLSQPDDSAVTCERYKYPQGGCRAVPELKSRAGICASKGSTVFHCACSVSAGWPCDSPTCWDSSVHPHKSQSGKGREWVHPKKCSFELVTVTRGSCRTWEG